MPKLTSLKLSRRHLLILIVLVLVVGGGYWWWQREQSLKKAGNFEIENQHPNWTLGLREGGEEELTALVEKYLGEDGYLKITLTEKETIQTYVPDSFPIMIRGSEVHATLGLSWEGNTQHLFLGPEEGMFQDQDKGPQPLNFYPSFDVFHLFGKKDKDDNDIRLTEEEWEEFVFNPLFTLTPKKS